MDIYQRKKQIAEPCLKHEQKMGWNAVFVMLPYHTP